jgi:hypothetical protein
MLRATSQLSGRFQMGAAFGIPAYVKIFFVVED